MKIAKRDRPYFRRSLLVYNIPMLNKMLINGQFFYQDFVENPRPIECKFLLKSICKQFHSVGREVYEPGYDRFFFQRLETEISV